MKKAIKSLAEQWGVSMSVFNNDIQTTPVAPSKNPQSSTSTSSSGKIQRTLEVQSRQQSLTFKNNNSNYSTSRKRNRVNPHPPTDQETARENLDKLPLQLIQEFNEAWKKADTMIPSRGFTLVHPVSASNVYWECSSQFDNY
jgi:hypothetical protein